MFKSGIVVGESVMQIPYHNSQLGMYIRYISGTNIIVMEIEKELEIVFKPQEYANIYLNTKFYDQVRRIK